MKNILSVLIIFLSFNSIGMTSVYAGERDKSKSVRVYTNADGSGGFSGSFDLDEILRIQTQC